jgi:hypothetical protein
VCRHALPLFTSLLNTVCGYIPGGILPYNHLIWADSKERLVEVALQVLSLFCRNNNMHNRKLKGITALIARCAGWE